MLACMQGDQKMIVAEACVQPLGLDNAPTNNEDVRRAQRDIDCQRLPDMNEKNPRESSR